MPQNNKKELYQISYYRRRQCFFFLISTDCVCLQLRTSLDCIIEMSYEESVCTCIFDCFPFVTS